MSPSSSPLELGACTVCHHRLALDGETLRPHVSNGHICEGSYLAPKRNLPIGPPISRPRKSGKNTTVQTFLEQDAARRAKTIRHTALTLAVQYLDSSRWSNPEVKALEVAQKFEAYLKGEEEK